MTPFDLTPDLWRSAFTGSIDSVRSQPFLLLLQLLRLLKLSKDPGPVCCCTVLQRVNPSGCSSPSIHRDVLHHLLMLFQSGVNEGHSVHPQMPTSATPAIEANSRELITSVMSSYPRQEADNRRLPPPTKRHSHRQSTATVELELHALPAPRRQSLRNNGHVNPNQVLRKHQWELCGLLHSLHCGSVAVAQQGSPACRR